MTSNSQPPTSNFSHLSLFVWVGLQALAIAGSAMGVPLWQNAPRAGDTIALSTLMVAQILGAALLLPRLTESWQSTLIAAATVLPLTLIAGILNAADIATIGRAALFADAWIVSLRFVRAPLRDNAALVAAGFASAWVAGGPFLLFLATDYASPPLVIDDGRLPPWTGPILAGVRFTGGFDFRLLLPLFLPAIVGLLLAFGGRLFLQSKK